MEYFLKQILKFIIIEGFYLKKVYKNWTEKQQIKFFF